MTSKLSGKVALVTGGAKRVGRAIVSCRLFASIMVGVSSRSTNGESAGPRIACGKRAGLRLQVRRSLRAACWARRGASLGRHIGRADKTSWDV